MKNTIKKAAISTGEFVAKHKVAIACTLTAAATAVVMKKLHDTAVSGLREFIEDEVGIEKYDTWIAEKTIETLTN